MSKLKRIEDHFTFKKEYKEILRNIVEILNIIEDKPIKYKVHTNYKKYAHSNGILELVYDNEDVITKNRDRLNDFDVNCYRYKTKKNKMGLCVFL